jgi:hypothetical protein
MVDDETVEKSADNWCCQFASSIALNCRILSYVLYKETGIRIWPKTNKATYMSEIDLQVIMVLESASSVVLSIDSRGRTIEYVVDRIK